ncbi:MAG TPA: sigma 54-interacting transcriptional regulator, partial [Leptospiraceae bacterium]|nr:sigma 54-interacting transcriptional regulator [Leptospiraceae bacterium]
MKNSLESFEVNQLIGASSPIVALKDKIISLAELDVPVYIQGDSGTGKKLIANLIAGKRILQIDCANFSSDLNFLIQKYANKTAKTLHIRGESIKVTGPLYFDKLEFLDTEGQAILFRVLENQEFVTAKKERVDFSSRIFLSSNKHLPQMVKDGLFR